MTRKMLTGLFVCEGTSDLPLADIVEALFLKHGCPARLSKPDFQLLASVPHDVRSRLKAGMRLLGRPVDIVVIHRDADRDGWEARAREIKEAVSAVNVSSKIIPIIPVRMTEAWLLLDERAIRQVSGNPNGRMDLGLPKPNKVERMADPKTFLRQCLLTASEANGRRRDSVAGRFPKHRRQLLERLDHKGPVARLASWGRLNEHIKQIADMHSGGT